MYIRTYILMQKDINLNDNDWRVHTLIFFTRYIQNYKKKNCNSKNLDMLSDFIGCRGSCVLLLFKFSKIIFEKKKCAFRISVISDWIFRFLVMDGNSTFTVVYSNEMKKKSKMEISILG